MASGFAPEFLILLGIDIFLGASILTVLLDRHFPGPYPYVLEGAALIGFAELMSGPSFLTSLSTELQFWYSFIYAMIAVLSLFGTNLYLLFLRRRAFESAILGICGTVPAGLGILYFTSAFVNGLTVSLPLIPAIPIEGVYAMFGLSIGLVVFSLVVFGRRKTAPSPLRERPIMSPIITRASGEASQLVMVEQPSPKIEVATPAAPSDSGTDESTPQYQNQTSQKPDATEAAGPSPGGDDRALPSMEAGGVLSTETVLVKKVEQTDYSKRLLDAIRFFEKAVDHPVRFDPKLLQGTIKGARKAYLTPAGMMMVEDSSGKMITMSLVDISTEEALKVMREVMKEIKGKGELP